jgi:FAD dependent oxidoreductase TIGR03364
MLQLVGRGLVVGAGVLGSLHALRLVEAGFDVVHLEADQLPVSASVRNFGLIWVSGRRTGEELDAARRGRRAWEELADRVPGIGFRATGSLTVAVVPEQLKVMEDFAHSPEAALRNIELVEPDRLQRRNPALSDAVLGGLWAPEDAVIEPGRVLGAIRSHLELSGRYQYVPDRLVTDAGTGWVVDHLGQRFEGDLVILAVGSLRSGLAGPLLAAAPMQRVALQMLSTEPLEAELTTAIADADSLRYYPAYSSARLEELPPRTKLAEEHEMQLLMVQRADGTLTVGDTHRYAEPFDFAYSEEVADELVQRAGRILAHPLPRVVRRWSGVYTRCLDDRLCYRAELLPQLWVVTGPGGRGMTCAPAIAEDTLRGAGVA